MSVRYMYVPGRATVATTGPTIGLPAGWSTMVATRPVTSVTSVVPTTMAAPADLLATISMFEQQVKTEPMSFYATSINDQTGQVTRIVTAEEANEIQQQQQQQQQQQTVIIDSMPDEKDPHLTSVVCSTINDEDVKGKVLMNIAIPVQAVTPVPTQPATPGGGGRTSKPQECKLCGKTLSSASSYYVHMKLHSGNKPFSCSCCDAAFCRKPYLEVHMRTHTGERPYPCDMCEFRFAQKSSLNAHRRVHTGERPYQCDICHLRVTQKSALNTHMRIHSGDRPYQCDICQIRLTQKSALNTHKRIHTGERPFQCEICLKRFTQKSSLNTHKRVHTGERPYACDICEKRFAVKSYVTAHRWSHVADKPLTCDRCNMTFTSKNQFAIHIRSHSSSQSFECNVCGRTFIRDSYLIRHHNRVHRDNPRPQNDNVEIAQDESQQQQQQQQVVQGVSTQTVQIANAEQGTIHVIYTNTADGDQTPQLRYVSTSTQMSPLGSPMSDPLNSPMSIYEQQVIQEDTKVSVGAQTMQMTVPHAVSMPSVQAVTMTAAQTQQMINNRPRGRPAGVKKIQMQ